MSSILAYVGLGIPLSTGQVLELSVERWLLLNLLALILLVRRVRHQRHSLVFVALLFVAPLLAAALLALGSSVVLAGTRYPEPPVARAVLSWSFAAAVVTGVGALPLVLFFRGGLARRLLVVSVSLAAVVLSLAALLPHPDHILYRPWSIQLLKPSWSAPQSGRRA